MAPQGRVIIKKRKPSIKITRRKKKKGSNKVEKNEGQKHNREKMVMIIDEWRVINVSSRGQPNPAGVKIVRVLLPLGGSDPAQRNYPQGLAVVRVAASPIPEMVVGGAGGA